MCCDNKIDLSDLRDGDEVKTYQYGWLKIHDIEQGTIYPIRCKHPNPNKVEVISFTTDGRQLHYELNPSIVEVRRKPRMVKKTVQGWIVIHKNNAKTYTEDKGFWERNNLSVKYIVPVSGEYEEAE